MSQVAFPKKITFAALVIFILGSLFYLYEFILQVSPSVMTSQLMHDFSADATLVGFLSGAFFYTYTIMQIPAGLLLDRYGARLLLTIATFVCAASTLIFALTHNIYLAGFARAMMGFVSACAFTGTLYLILRWFPPKRFALFAGILQSLSSVGAIAGVLILTFVLHHVIWRTAFFALALIGFLLTFVILFFVRNHSPQFVESSTTQVNYIDNLKTVFSQSQTWWIGLFSCGIWAPIAGFAALWGIPFVKTSFHFSDVMAADAISAIWIGLAIGSPLIGWISDYYRNRRIPLMMCALLGALSMFGIIFLNHPPIYLIFSLMFCIGLSASAQSLIFALIKDNQPPHTSSTANGVNNACIVLSGALFQPLIGDLLDHNWTGQTFHHIHIYTLHAYHIALLAMPICFLISATTVLFLKETYCQSVYDLHQKEVEQK